jgi:predicted nucleic-acid-binding Zn-ribbon protein
MKRSKRCPKCSGRDIGALRSNILVGQYLRTWQEKHPVYREEMVDKSKTIDVTAEQLRLFCLACGYSEEYLQALDRDSVQSLPGFFWHNAEPPADGPFR